jgi:uncharacterized membrane protein YeaQ/YmgE (transglycosylase-associated protein family)
LATRVSTAVSTATAPKKTAVLLRESGAESVSFTNLTAMVPDPGRQLICRLLQKGVCRQPDTPPKTHALYLKCRNPDVEHRLHHKREALEGGGDKQNMSIILRIVFGLVIGVIAKLLMPGRDPGGFVITILLGIAGSFVGGLIGKAVGLYRPGQRTAGRILSIIGAIVIPAIYRMIARRRTVLSALFSQGL